MFSAVLVSEMNSTRINNRLVLFYLGEQPDSEGRYIHDIWAWDDESLECVHDYIQWLFPLAEPSAYNPYAPILNEDVVQAFRQVPQLRQNLMTSYTAMLRFYGLQRQEIDSAIVVGRSDRYTERATEWVQPLDHNHLRITRILKCLMQLGLPAEAKAFYHCLDAIYRKNKTAISPTTFHYWSGAIKRV